MTTLSTPAVTPYSVIVKAIASGAYSRTTFGLHFDRQHEEGARAEEAGQPKSQNPYPVGSCEWASWATGWQDERERNS